MKSKRRHIGQLATPVFQYHGGMKGRSESWQAAQLAGRGFAAVHLVTLLNRSATEDDYESLGTSIEMRPIHMARFHQP
jgi:hypothetical protein